MSSPTSVATPLSLDTAYSSIWRDTPCSLRLTPVSLGTPRTPCSSATPLSQDSCYSSLQATPVLQGEPFANPVHKPVRRERRLRKPARHHRGEVADVPLFSRRTLSRQRLEQWRRNANAASSRYSYSYSGPSFQGASPCRDDHLSLTILKIKAMAEEPSASPRPLADRAPRRESYTPAAEGSDSPQQLAGSLDSRIESLLVMCQNSHSSHFDEVPCATDFPSQDSLTSAAVATDRSPDWPPASSSRCDDPSDVDPALPDENAEDETKQAVLFLQSQSPAAVDFAHAEQKIRTSAENDAAARCRPPSPPTVVSDILPSSFFVYICKTDIFKQANAFKMPSNLFNQVTLFESLCCIVPFLSFSFCLSQQRFYGVIESPCLTQVQTAADDNLHSTKGTFGASNLQPQTFLSLTNPYYPQPLVAPHPFTIPPFPPPFIPPVPPRLPNGTIPIPPPGWIPPPGRQSSRPTTSPHVSPLTFLRPPPMVPPPAQMFPVAMQPAGSLAEGNPPAAIQRPPWPVPLVPSFNPFVPPPGYPFGKKIPHRVTVEKVLEAIMEELKAIIKKDISRRTVEGIAFKVFEEWWECQEKKSKVEQKKLLVQLRYIVYWLNF